MAIDPDTRFAVADLYAAYAACLDHGSLAAWPDLFTDDCRYELVPRENYDAGLPLATMALHGRGMLQDRIYGSMNTLFHAPYYQRHVIGPPSILSATPTMIEATANYVVLRTKRDSMTDVFSAGRYVDRIARSERGLLFAEKLCVFDSDLIPNSVIYPI